MACALLYNFKDAARLQKVRFALFKLGVSGRVVAPEELSQPIGYLCDLEGFSPVEETVEGGFSDEMLVLCGLSAARRAALVSSPQPRGRRAQGRRHRGQCRVEFAPAARRALSGTRGDEGYAPQGCRKTLRAPQITLATAQSRRYNNRASNRSPIQVSIVSRYSEVGIALGLGEYAQPDKKLNNRV